ncbi:MAG TPA: WecB/TagA/CpsF family glycosyltransferase [Alphaproteobacteria bacterium]|nr:WecB/TagA/CpsF family glycosyltransferase [Alphaproteobacteria bacterium]
MSQQRIDFLGIPLDTGAEIGTVCDLIGAGEHSKLVTFVNPHAWFIARRHPDYVERLRQMSLVLPDGQGVVWACRLLAGQPCRRLSFDMSSVADAFFKDVAAKGVTLMLVGGEPSVDEDVEAKLHIAYPALKIFGTEHGYGEFAPKIGRLMERKPQAVVVGMGSPRQEEFLIALRAAGYKGFAITCGGFFDQYLKADQYYPPWVDRFNLRFLWRLYREPRRLWRRYLIEYWYFVGAVLRVLAERGVARLKKVQMG